MILTKYEHACFTVEKDDKLLVVDPGDFTNDFIPSNNIVAVFITHEHGDHAGHDLIQAIHDTNPDAILIGHADVLDSVPVNMKKRTVSSEDILQIEDFTLEFFGGEHLQTLPSSPVYANLGVLIDEKIYYAGDSFATPNKRPEALVLPVSGSWMKLSMAYDYFMELRPSIVIPTHDSILSVNGKKQVDKHIPLWTSEFTYTYTRATTGVSL